MIIIPKYLGSLEPGAVAGSRRFMRKGACGQPSICTGYLPLAITPAVLQSAQELALNVIYYIGEALCLLKYL